jgi:hypothetical protein
MSFDINVDITYLKPDGSAAKEPESREWNDLEKAHVVEHFEMAFNRAMLKMNRLSVDQGRGHSRKWTNTNPVEMRMDIRITEDGAKWMRSTYEWPNVGDEAQALLLGTIDGELSTMPDEVRGKRRGGKSADKKPAK